VSGSRAPLASAAATWVRFAGGFARGGKLAASPLREGLHPHLGQHLVGGSQLLPCLGAALLAAQPLPEEKVSATPRPLSERLSAGASRMVAWISSVTCVSWPRQAASIIAEYRNGGFPVASAISWSSSISRVAVASSLH
jgi:hypothetical protein